MDEAYNLGRGRYLDENGLKTKSDIMQAYLSFMQNLCQAYGFKPIVWDDMFFNRYIEKKIEPLKAALSETAKARRKIWTEECRAFGSDVLDHRFGAMLMRLEVTQEVLTDYIQGKIKQIDELEEDRLDPCPEADKTHEPQAVHYNRALRIMTACRETW